MRELGQPAMIGFVVSRGKAFCLGPRPDRSSGRSCQEVPSMRTAEPFARHVAEALPRRTSLLTLSGAALASGMSNAGVSAARKKGQTCKK
jgi:hypothetical protein